MTKFSDIDPATGETIAEIPQASAEQVHAAVARARAAQPEWCELGFEERARLLREGAKILADRAEEVARLSTREMGKPYADALREARGSAGSLEEELSFVERALAPEVLDGKGTRTTIERDPLGVVAAITPWNFPVLMPVQVIWPALATGNTVVFKPSELVPLCGALVAESLAAVLPDGVLELVQGPGEVGAELVAADVDLVGFVGSRDTGKRIMQSASGGLKRLVLELGGKDPLVVFADADLEAAAEVAVRHSLRNTGQVCCSVERVFVEESAAPRFEELVLEKARAWTAGNGFDEVDMGPMVSDEQREKVVAQVQDAVANGARLLCGGELPEGPGYFYPATVLADVSCELDVYKNETFGPVVSLTSFDGDEDEAVRLANDTPYGLGANVFTGDTERGQRIARRIRAGQIGINRYLGGVSGAPWVGARQSGFGFLGGVEGARQFTVPKSISYPV